MYAWVALCEVVCAGSLFGRSPTARTSIGSYGSPPTPGMAAAAAATAADSPSAEPPHAVDALVVPHMPPSLAALGPPDCTIRGAGFELHAHSAVLRQRCPVTQAQFASGMRDANARTVTLPPHFAEAPIRAALQYMYTDEAPLDEDTALPTLAAAVYFNMAHLAALCCGFIISHLRSQVRCAPPEPGLRVCEPAVCIVLFLLRNTFRAGGCARAAGAFRASEPC